jgi:hypothetical protein
VNFKAYPIPAQLLQAIVNYLQLQPWKDVNGLLQEISGIARVVDEMPQPKENGKDAEDNLNA